jgi:hypothetical protein
MKLFLIQIIEQNCSPRIENFRPTGFSGVSSGNILQQRLSQLKQRKQMTRVKTNLLDDSDKEFDNFSCKTEPVRFFSEQPAIGA